MLSCAAIGAALLAGAPAWACSVCGCGDPLLSSSDPAAVSGRMRLGIDMEYLGMKSGTPSDVLDQYTLRLSGVLSPAPGLSVIAQLPLTRKNLNNADGTGSRLSGLGDVEVGGRYTLVDVPDLAKQRRQTFAVSAGTSLPTGARATTFDGHEVDEHGQLGTGAWGPWAGLHYRLEQRQWTVFASLSGRLRTTNSEGYHYGDALLWSVHGQLWVASQLSVDLGVDARHAAADATSGVAVEDTGGTVLAAAPGIYWNATGPLWLAARAQLPFYTHLYGVQSVGPTVTFGVQYLVL
jgi:hypothetical protein